MNILLIEASSIQTNRFHSKLKVKLDVISFLDTDSFAQKDIYMSLSRLSYGASLVHCAV